MGSILLSVPLFVLLVICSLPLLSSFRLHGQSRHSRTRDTRTLTGVGPGAPIDRPDQHVVPQRHKLPYPSSRGGSNSWTTRAGPGVTGSLPRLQRLVDSGERAKFVREFKTLASNLNERVTPDDMKTVYGLADVVVERSTGEQLADMVWSLGKMADKYSNEQFSAQHQKLWRRLCSQEAVTARQVTTCFGGFAKLELRWNSMKTEDRHQLEGLVLAVADTLNEREVGNMLHSLGRMGVQWSELSSPVREALLGSLVRQQQRMRDEHGAMSVYALGVMGATVDQLSAAQRESVLAIATVLLQDINRDGDPSRSRCQQAANIIYGLAKLTVQLSSSLPRLQESVLRTLSGPLLRMNAQEVSNVVYSLCVIGVKWSGLSAEARTAIESAMTAQLPRMITQGLSTTLYGLGMMDAPWSTMAPATIQALKAAMLRCFGSRNLVPENDAQAIANAVYALGFCQVGWTDLPGEVHAVLMRAAARCGPHFKAQELANLVYGASDLTTELRHAIEAALVRLSDRLQEQELSSFLYGLVKLEQRWDELSPHVRESLGRRIVGLGAMSHVCLACTVYSLGMLGAPLTSLPQDVPDLIAQAARALPLTDQTLSNTLYGLSLMGAEWDTLPAELRDRLLTDLASPSAFLVDTPQHVSNSIWALGKMDATWALLPGEALITALLRCVDRCSPQELANTVYGLAIMDVPWGALSAEAVTALEKALVRLVGRMGVQEVANVMYSLALLSFDSYSPEDIVGLEAGKRDDVEGGTGSDRNRRESLWRIHEAVLRAFLRKDPAQYQRENYDQFAVYFELLRVLKGGEEVLTRLCGRPPQPSGPAGTVPSKMHAMTVQAMAAALSKRSSAYEYCNEFNGLQGVFPIDAAVFHAGQLVALVEIDGEFHYKSLGQQLRRKDRLKEFLYRCHYPTVPLYRMRCDQLQVIGYPRAGEALASWIHKRVEEKKAT